METIKDDTVYIMNKLFGLKCPPKLGKKRKAGKAGKETTAGMMAKRYSTIPEHLIEKLYLVYRRDFEVFGFSKILPGGNRSIS